MLTYCVKCRKNTENLDSNIFKAKNNRIIMLSKCSICEIPKSRFVKEQEAKGLLSSLDLKIPLNKIPLLGDICFKCIKMNDIVDQFLLAGDKFMPGFTYSACGPFTKNKERIEKFMKTGNTDFI